MSEVSELLLRAADGDRSAWESIVDRYAGLVWSVVRSFRLDSAAASDVTQTVWLRLIEHCGRIREPDRLPGWLAVTARNEALRVLRGAKRQVPSDFDLDVEDTSQVPLDERLVDGENQRAALRAFGRLPVESQTLMRLLCTDPPLDYATISGLVGRPIGSIGPTRQRIVEKLKVLMAAELGEDQRDSLGGSANA